MNQTYERKNVEYPKMIYFIKLSAENFEGEQLTEEDIFEFMVDQQSSDVGKVIEALIEF